jgi:enolase-phosphatase E1
MISFTGRMVLLDIEGTTTSISFVHDILFPYARLHSGPFLEENATTAEVLNALDLMAQDARAADFTSWCPHPWSSAMAREWLLARIYEWMDADAKLTGLKYLQGLIWEAGYLEDGQRAHIFPDVPKNIRTLHAAGISVRIYSSGSVPAQKILFAHTEAGDLTPWLSGYYDTTVGSKRDAASYTAIAVDASLPPDEILFLSDIPEELDAAHTAGLKVALVERPGNRPVGATPHPRIRSFDEIILTGETGSSNRLATPGKFRVP